MSTYPCDDLKIIRLDAHLQNVVHPSGEVEFATSVDICAVGVFVLNRAQAHHVTMIVVGLCRGNDLCVWSDVSRIVATVAEAGG